MYPQLKAHIVQNEVLLLDNAVGGQLQSPDAPSGNTACLVFLLRFIKVLSIRHGNESIGTPR